MILLAKYVVFLFAIFFILAGIMMLTTPIKALSIIGKAGSTALINYSEITIRMIPAISMIVYAEHSKFPIPFQLFGWFMLGTSVVLFFVPPKLHHQFASSWSKILKPIHLQILSVFSFAAGMILWYAVY